MTKDKSDLSRAFSEDGAFKTHVGGQALLEGVMMRGRYNWAVAVREPSGSIYIEEHDLASGRPKNSWMNWPFVRGCRAMVESLILGYKALEIAALHAFDDEDEKPDEEPSAPSAADESVRMGVVVEAAGADVDERGVMAEAADGRADDVAADKSEDEVDYEFGKKEVAISMVLGLLLGIAAFIVLPALLTNLIVGEYDANAILWNVVDGILRVAVFVAYLWGIGRMSDIKRMFGYHGAEHKTIHCYEHGLELTPENARSFPRLHVRCGTAFLIMVMIIAILVYTIVPLNPLIAAWGVPDGAPKLLLVILVRILFMPVIAGISYEITVKWAGSHPDNPLVKVVLWPGMQMQHLTTNEPDDSMLECAIAAMKNVLAREEAEARSAQESSQQAAPSL